MRGLFCLRSLLFLFGFLRLAHAQEPGKIVEQYVKAAGGGRALSKIQALAVEGTFTTDDGKSGTYTFDTKLPNRYYLELLVGWIQQGKLSIRVAQTYPLADAAQAHAAFEQRQVSGRLLLIP